MLEDATDRALAGFAARFGREPRWVASAPGRVNLIGEFTDYNEGFVLPIALEHRTVVVGALNDSDRVTVRSEASPQEVAIHVKEALAPGPRGSWSNYACGVLAGFVAKGVTPRGFDAFVASDVPIGAGLSSSAALEVAFATLLEGVHDVKLDPVSKALLCQRAEHDFAMVPCGIMDPFITTLGREGHALLLDCRSRESVWLPLTDRSVSVLIINTNVKHELATSAYSVRRNECSTAAAWLRVSSLREASLASLEHNRASMDATIVRRARHVVGEIARTARAATCIREGNWPEFGQLMNASHESLRDDYEVSCAELDLIAGTGQQIGAEGGVFGCRMTGGGFGGCAVALIAAKRRDQIVKTIDLEYRTRTNIVPTFLTSRPGGGARLSEL